MDNSPDHIMLLDRQYHIQFINRTRIDMRVEDVIGRSVFEYLGQQFHGSMEDTFAQVFATAEPAQFEMEYLDPDV